MLTDKEYLEHMIPHHEVAVVMSQNLERSSNSPAMLAIAWHIIWFQEFEIAWMKGMVEYDVPSITHDSQRGKKFTPGNLIDCYYPKASQDLNVTLGPVRQLDTVLREGPVRQLDTVLREGPVTGPMFEPTMHRNKKVSDKQFLTHMIPHHQIAINMSRELLKYTRDTRMMELAYKIIGSQQYEIWLMKGILKNFRLYHSELLSN